ncbi:MAG: FadR family transcriptional regulator [Deltaproteobacteria bacterium HGW-Deltaproteobacteria-15]|jgi:DNA-binding FadR family transcriptional regulator|nr:MAG: FadR family transcriptional regulator [Deltaproteobacteria bacterium HGW-Deltaproteobacteria-15]
MPAFKPIKQSRISKEVTEQLKHAILLGQFQTGDKLPPERELAEQFQVSRVAVRESLRVLENTGFLTTRPGVSGGTFVTDLTFEHLSNAFIDLFLAEKISIPELVHVRVLVEPEIARLAASHVDEESAHLLRELLEAEEVPSRTLVEDINKKTSVHYILAEVCANHFLEALERSLMAMTRRVVQVVEPQPLWLHPAGMHRPIVDAVLARNADEAAEAMRKHAIEFGENLIKMAEIFREKKVSSGL